MNAFTIRPALNMRVVQEARRIPRKPSNSWRRRWGFNDEAYFTRFFHKHTGVSRKQFRELAAQQITLSEASPDNAALEDESAQEQEDDDMRTV
ncbi:hypothetical protein [Brenneria izadpanahii]|uniref:hypothetical protein n=1 Tax=Brenneria izadpanahii TaxID=2722756 RepID=UPI001FE56D5B|nr:hypothetical protein [Brenneria izadpanahii]